MFACGIYPTAILIVLGTGNSRGKKETRLISIGSKPFFFLTLKIPMTKRTEFLGSLQPSQKIPN